MGIARKEINSDQAAAAAAAATPAASSSKEVLSAASTARINDSLAAKDMKHMAVTAGVNPAIVDSQADALLAETVQTSINRFRRMEVKELKDEIARLHKSGGAEVLSSILLDALKQELSIRHDARHDNSAEGMRSELYEYYEQKYKKMTPDERKQEYDMICKIGNKANLGQERLDLLNELITNPPLLKKEEDQKPSRLPVENAAENAPVKQPEAKAKLLSKDELRLLTKLSYDRFRNAKKEHDELNKKQEDEEKEWQADDQDIDGWDNSGDKNQAWDTPPVSPKNR